MKSGSRTELFALAVILQMLLYTGRPLLGAVRYVLLVYPAFLVGKLRAERWNWKQLSFYVRSFRIPESGLAVGVSELVAGL